MSDLTERLRNEPVLILVIAGGALVLGIDLDIVTRNAEKVIDLIVLVGFAGVARHRVVPERKLEPPE